MFVRGLIWFYYPLLYLGLGFSRSTGNNVWQGLVFVLAGVYVYARFIKSIMGRDHPVGRVRLGKCLVLAFAFVGYYSVTYFLRSKSGLEALASVPTLFMHLLFWNLAYSSESYAGKEEKYFKDVFISIFFGFLFGFVNALAYTSFSFLPGSIHDLSEASPFVRSDVDVPLLALGVLSAVFPAVPFSRWRRLGGPSLFSPVVTYSLLAVTLLSMWLYSRRGPLLAAMFLIVIGASSQQTRKKVLLSLCAFPVLPLLWRYVSDLLIELSQNEFVSTFLVRNKVEDYLTATGRLASWLKGFDFMASFQPNHLIGYGGAPSHFVLGPGHFHMHNMVLDLFFDSGFIGLTLAAILIVLAFRVGYILLEVERPLVGVESLFLFLSAWAVLAPIEPMLHSYTASHMVFLTIAASLFNAHRYNGSIHNAKPMVTA